MQILNLSDYNILNEISVNDHDYCLVVEIKYPPQFQPSCPNCESVNIYRHGTRRQLFLDLPIRGKRMGIEVIRQRYRYRECKEIFHDHLPGMCESHRATQDLVDYIKKESLNRTFTSIAEEIGLDESTIRNICDEYITYLDKTFHIETPEWLGIDEVSLTKGKFYTVISSLKGKRGIVEMLPTRDKSTVSNFFNSLSDREKIRVVCMDMNWLSFKYAVEECLPKARIVVDRFHFVQMANEALIAVIKFIRRKVASGQLSILMKRRNKLSNDERITLENFLKDSPLLERAYILKEDFCNIYNLKDKSQAFEQCKMLQDQIPMEIKPAFESLIKAVKSWDEEIFAYFDERVTNGYTEGLNSLIRLVNDTGRGYSFKVIRARMLYHVGRHNLQRPSYQKIRISSRNFDNAM